MKNIKFSESISINRPIELVFDFTQDYSKRLSWDTFLIKAELIDANKAKEGVKVFCVARNGIGMETEYVSFNRPKVTAVKMTKGPYMFESFLGSWNFKAINEHQTEVIFLYSYTLRFPFSLFSFFIKRNLQKNVRMRLRDLKGCVEG